jgi:hypothetical protein
MRRAGDQSKKYGEGYRSAHCRGGSHPACERTDDGGRGAPQADTASPALRLLAQLADERLRLLQIRRLLQRPASQ